MSGHSKWSKIQHKKGANDARRSSMFTKLTRGITVAAQQGGGDPEMNFSLRVAIDKAKAANVPKDNIDRAIKRGTGELKDGAVLQEVLYEGFGPKGVAFIIDTVTDNTNRTVSEVKNVFTKAGGSLGGPGSVTWQFEQKAVVRFTADKKEAVENWEEFELALMDAGIDDIRVSDEGVELLAAKEHFQQMMAVIEQHQIDPDDSGLEWVAKEELELDADSSTQVERVYEALTDLDDVREVYTNEG